MELKDFVVEFFETAGADVFGENGRTVVVLPEELQRLFGKEELSLVFNSKDIDEDSELVTHGSFVLNKIHSFLQDTGQKVVCSLSEKYDFDEARIQKGIRIRNGEISAFKGKRHNSVDIVFNFKITYLSDEKIEELHSIVINKYGNIFQPYEYYHGEDIVPKTEKKTVKVTRKYIENSFRECARHVSEYARTEGARHKNEILQRLYKNVVRLKGFYEAQIAEIPVTSPQYEHKRALYVNEYEKKLAEEIENHGIKIVLNLVSYQVIERTDIECRVEIEPGKETSGSKEALTHNALFDPYNGGFDLGLCPACNAPMGEIVVCDTVRLACEHCTYTCSSCEKTFSRFRVKPEQCKTCDSELCEQCTTKCFDCRKPVCPDHTRVCEIGQEAVCSECVSVCSVCGKGLCEDHSFICSATGERVCFEHKFICKVCRQIYSMPFISSRRNKSWEDNTCPSCSKQEKM